MRPKPTMIEVEQSKYADLCNLSRYKDALERIADYDGEPIWKDDRDDAANDMLSIAREALGIEV